MTAVWERYGITQEEIKKFIRFLENSSMHDDFEAIHIEDTAPDNPVIRKLRLLAGSKRVIADALRGVMDPGGSVSQN